MEGGEGGQAYKWTTDVYVLGSGERRNRKQRRRVQVQVLQAAVMAAAKWPAAM